MASVAVASSSKAGTVTVSRAVQLMVLFADAQEPVTIKYIADRLNLASSTTHRLLQLLRKEGFSEVHGKGRQYCAIAARAQHAVEAAAQRFDEPHAARQYRRAIGQEIARHARDLSCELGTTFK